MIVRHVHELGPDLWRLAVFALALGWVAAFLAHLRSRPGRGPG